MDTELELSTSSLTIYCPDCRGKFEVENDDIIEGEVLECHLCSAFIEVIQEQPIKLRLYNEDDYL